MVKSKKKPEKGDIKKEEICEIFDIEKAGKTKEEEVCNVVEKKPATKEQIQNQNKILRNIFIGLGILVLLIIIGVYYVNSLRHFEYRGIKGDVVKEGKLIFYQIGIPIEVNAQEITYNIFLRNNPEDLDEIPFKGEMIDFEQLSRFSDGAYRLVLNASDEFDCDDDELIAIGNMMNLKALGFRIVRDVNATCDKNGRYIYINLKKADVSEINQIGNACYELSISNCEILKVTERFMTEMIVKDNEIRNSENGS